MKLRPRGPLIAAAILLAGCVTMNRIAGDRIDLRYADISAEQAQAALARAEQAVDDVSGFLNRPAKRKIIIEIRDRPNYVRASANFEYFKIEIPADHFADGQMRPDTAIVHEVTHLIAGPSGSASSFLHEGLAVYLHEKLSRPDEAFSAAHIDVHDIVKRFILDRDAVVPLHNIIFDNFAFANDEQSAELSLGRTRAYFQAASFVKYLVETYGAETFMKGYEGDPFHAPFGKSMGELESAWLAFLRRR